jgi:hypothetical protein
MSKPTVSYPLAHHRLGKSPVIRIKKVNFLQDAEASQRGLNAFLDGDIKII